MAPPTTAPRSKPPKGTGPRKGTDDPLSILAILAGKGHAIDTEGVAPASLGCDVSKSHWMPMTTLKAGNITEDYATLLPCRWRTVGARRHDVVSHNSRQAIEPIATKAALDLGENCKPQEYAGVTQWTWEAANCKQTHYTVGSAWMASPSWHSLDRRYHSVTADNPREVCSCWVVNRGG